MWPTPRQRLVQRNLGQVLSSAILSLSRARRIDPALGIVSPFVRPRREILPGRTFRRLVTPPPPPIVPTFIPPRRAARSSRSSPGQHAPYTVRASTRRDLNDTTIPAGLFMVARSGTDRSILLPERRRGWSERRRFDIVWYFARRTRWRTLER